MQAIRDLAEGPIDLFAFARVSEQWPLTQQSLGRLDVCLGLDFCLGKERDSPSNVELGVSN